MNTDEHGAAQPQPKLWSTVRFGVRQLAAAFVRVELLRLRKGASKLAHSKEDPQECWKNPCPDYVCSGNLSSVIGHWSLVIGHLEETADLALGPSPLDKTS